MIYPRQIYTQLETEIGTNEIIVITGMRRVGKTTTLMHLYDLVKSRNKAFFDLENPLNRKIFEEENYDAIWNNLAQFGIDRSTKAFLFIDEMQNLPEISKVVKYFYDHWEVKFFLTGSSSYYLRNLFPESLAGRKLVYELFPLDFSEFLVFHQVDRIVDETLEGKARNKNRISYDRLIRFYDEFMEFGGFPSVVLENNPSRKKQFLSEIFISYFEKDVKNLADFRELSKLRDLILLLAARVGSRLEIVKLANSLSVSRETVYNYLSFLEQTYFITLLPRHSGSVDRQSAGSRKLFYCDNGLVNILGKISQGQLFEQSVFQNLRSRYGLAYYMVEGSREIDFIADSQYALEVKYTMSQQDLSILLKRSNALAIRKNFVITHQYHDSPQAILATDL